MRFNPSADLEFLSLLKYDVIIFGPLFRLPGPKIFVDTKFRKFDYLFNLKVIRTDFCPYQQQGKVMREEMSEFRMFLLMHRICVTKKQIAKRIHRKTSIQ